MYYDCWHHPVIGIDFGTVYSSISKWNGERAEVYSVMGEYAIPSVVYFNQEKFDVGTGALAKGIFCPENYVTNIKTMISEGEKIISFHGKEFTLIDIISIILKYIYNNIKSTVPEGKLKCEGAVIAVPCYFDDRQCNIIKEGAKLAGIELVGIIQEPVAIALAYEMYTATNKKTEENVLVFDLGGGSLDITVIRVTKTKGQVRFKILASETCSNLGGLNFDEDIYNFILKKERINLNSYDYKTCSLCRRNLMDQIIKSKDVLYYNDEVAYIRVYNVPPGNFLDTTITLKELNKCIEHYIVSIKNMIEYTIGLSTISKSDIQKVIKAGGGSKFKAIDNIIEDTLGKTKIYKYIDYKEVISNGAAIYAAYKTNRLSLDKQIIVSTENTEKNFHFIWMIDCSGSMNIHNRLSYVKEGLKLVIPEIEQKCSLEDINVNFGILKFSDNAVWSVKIGEKVSDVIYEDIKSGGITSLGSAIDIVNRELNEIKINCKTLIPVIFLITDGMPTDHYDEAVEQLLTSFMGKNAYKDVIAIGSDVCMEYMCKFIDDVSRSPKVVLQKECIIKSICSRALESVEYVKHRVIDKYNEDVQFLNEFPKSKIKGGLLLKTPKNK